MYIIVTFRASAVAIGQALLEAGYILCISQLEQVFVDDYVLYRPLRQGSGDQERVVQEDLVCSQEFGQEPLWVKQISSITEDVGKKFDQGVSVNCIFSGFQCEKDI